MSDRPRSTRGRPEAMREASSTLPAVPSDRSISDRTARRGRILLEYVTFGYGIHHLLKVLLLQFVMLFLDVRILANKVATSGPMSGHLVTITWLFASIVFLTILAVLVRQIGRRTLAPRYHRRIDITASVVGYLFAAGLSFAFGYVTFILPTRGVGQPALPSMLHSWLLVVMLATFIAIGYHAQVSDTANPGTRAIRDTIGQWLDSLSWVEEAPDSLRREDAYEEFDARTADLERLLSHARTVEARELEADFVAWRESFETRSTLSQELVVQGPADDDGPESARLAGEHESFVDLRRRLAAVARSDLVE